jgi:rhodanese-related sulfurtransferase
MKPQNLSFLLCLLASLPLFAQNNYKEITLMDLMKKKIAGDKNMVIIDVRTRGEYNDTPHGKSGDIGRIRGAINIPLQELMSDSQKIHQFDDYKDKDIYLICSHSYRSRTVSNMLLKNGFKNVNNTRGGMTEWYRRFNELVAYRDQLDQTDINYRNISSAELFSSLGKNNQPMLIGIRNTPRFFWDSGTVLFYKYFPLLKDARYFDLKDSLKLFELVANDKQRPVILFNMVNSGAAEMAEWLKQKGISNASYLVGGINLLYEYAIDNLGKEIAGNFFTTSSAINFLTPSIYCTGRMYRTKTIQAIDLRADSLFNKVTEGVKHDYSHFKGSLNFHFTRGAEEFEKEFPNKNTEYLFFNSFGSDGIELADALTKKGYKVSWMIGGYDRWEWFMNNMENFSCQDLFEK